MADTVRAITDAGIPVVGHIGLTPQSVSQLGGYRVQGRTADAARRLLDDALALQEAGAVMIVLEMVPDRLAGLITERLRIPTIGIGAGPLCDGQVLVLHDLVGLFDRFTPRFAKRYADLFGLMEQALTRYREEVETGLFPAREHSFSMSEEEWEALQAALAKPQGLSSEGSR